MKRLTAAVQEKIVSAVAGGNYRGTAAAAAGVDRETFQKWMERGEKAKSGKHREFYKAVLQAEAEMVERILGWMEKADPERTARFLQQKGRAGAGGRGRSKQSGD